MIRDTAAGAPLIGRRDELERIRRALRNLAVGRSGVVELVGEPGIGKTALFEQAVKESAGQSVTVLTGFAHEAERAVPFAVLDQAIAGYRGTARHAMGPALTDDVPAAVAAVLPSLGKRPRWQSTNARADRYVIHHQLRLLLARLATGTGLLLAIDDLHWADEASGDFLAFLLRRPPDCPVSVLLAYRPRQLPVRMAAGLADAMRSWAVERIEVAPLGANEIAELVRRPLSSRERVSLHRAAEGNPLYAQALAASGAAALEDRVLLAGAEIPDAVRVSLLSELDGLPERDRLVARAAAVAGEPIDPVLTAAVATLPEADVLAALDSLHGRDLVRRNGSGSGQVFRHAILRQVIYDSGGPGWIRGAHERAASVLADRGSAAVERARHVEQVARRGDASSIAVLGRAAADVSAVAPATAARWYCIALELVTEGPTSPLRPQLLFGLARSLGVSGQFTRARDALESLSGITEDPVARTRLVAARAAVGRLLGRHNDALALLENELHTADPAGLPALLLELATHHFVQGNHAQQLRCAERARATAPATGIQASSAAVLACLAHCGLGDLHAATRRLKEAARITDGLTDGELAVGLETLTGLVLAETGLDLFADAIRHGRRGAAVGRDTRQDYALPPLLTALAEALLEAGQVGSANDVISEAVDIAVLTANKQARMAAQARAAQISWWAGDLAGAKCAAAEALELSSGESGWLPAVIRGNVTVLRAMTGEHTAGGADLADGYGGVTLPLVSAAHRPRVYGVLVDAELARGGTKAAERAGRWAERATRAAAAFPLGSAEGYSLLAQATAQIASAPSQATRCAAAAVAQLCACGAQLGAARARLAAGAALAAAGRISSAAQELLAAEHGFRTCGAEHLAHEAWLRRQTYVSGAAAARSDRLGTLSPRERQVAGLLAEGQTNHQIARVLAITDKTVEAHVSSIFRKLRVPSRAAVAGLVARQLGDAHTGNP